MTWTESAEGILAALLRMVPETMRPLAESSARAEAEGLAAERAASSVAVEDVVRGWISTTPGDQRDSLVEVLEGLGLDPEDYAEELSAVYDEDSEI
jgi:hypothetical protein